MEVVLDHGDTFAEADDVVVAGDEVKALVINLARSYPLLVSELEDIFEFISYHPSIVRRAIM